MGANSSLSSSAPLPCLPCLPLSHLSLPVSHFAPNHSQAKMVLPTACDLARVKASRSEIAWGACSLFLNAPNGWLPPPHASPLPPELFPPLPLPFPFPLPVPCALWPAALAAVAVSQPFPFPLPPWCGSQMACGGAVLRGSPESHPPLPANFPCSRSPRHGRSDLTWLVVAHEWTCCLLVPLSPPPRAPSEPLPLGSCVVCVPWCVLLRVPPPRPPKRLPCSK